MVDFTDGDLWLGSCTSNKVIDIIKKFCKKISCFSTIWLQDYHK